MIQPEQTAILIIDMINDFQFGHGSILAERSIHIVKNINTLKKFARAEQMPVIYINDHYGLWQADFDRIISHCLNDLSRPIIESIIPDDDDYFLIKPKHSAFYGTALHTLLQQLKIKSLILTGIAGNICVLFTANDAYMREYELVIPKDCIASNNIHDNEYALQMMKEVLKADICMTDDLIDSF